MSQQGWWKWRWISNLTKQLILDRDARAIARKHSIPVALPSFWERLRGGRKKNRASS